MRYEDLPAGVRRQVDAQLAQQLPPGEPVKVRRAGGAIRGPVMPLRCHSCGEVFDPPSETRQRRHSKETGHRRFELILGPLAAAR